MKKLLVLSVAALAATRLFAGSDNTWTGLASPVNLWSDPLNWTVGTPVAGDNLFFGAGALELTNTNDLAANTLFGNITFDPGAGAFVITGSTIDTGSDITNNEGTNAQSFGVPINLQGSINVSSVAGGVMTLSGVISEASASGITKIGNGVVSLTGANTFTGGVLINAGTLILGNNTAAGSGSVTLNGGTLQTAALQPSQPFVIQGNSTINNTGSITFGGALSGDGTLNMASTNNQLATWNASMSAFNGTINILSNQTVRFNSGGGNPATGSANATFNLGTGTGGLTMRNSTTINIGALTGGPGTFLTGNSTNTTNFPYSVGGLNTNTTFDGQFRSSSNISATGSTSLVKVGNGILTIGNNQPYTGNTTINAGTLSVSSVANGHIRLTASTLTSGSPTVTVTDTTGLVAGMTVVGGGLANGATILSVDSPTQVTISVNAGASGAAANLYFGFANGLGLGNTTSGALTLNGGNLRYTGAGHSSNRLFSVGTNGGSIEAAGSGILGLTGTGALNVSGAGDRTLTLTGTGVGTLAAAIGDPTGGGLMNVTKSGPGVWQLSGASTFTGVALVSAGTLSVTGSLAGGVSVQEGAMIAGNGTFAGISTVGSNQGGKIDPDGTMTATSLTWGGSSDASATLLIELGPGGLSDSIALSGALTKGAGTSFVIDFGNTGFLNNVYTLISYASTDLTDLDISFVNLPFGVPGVLSVGANSITLSTVPEPSTWAMILGGIGLGLAVLRRRRAVR